MAGVNFFSKLSKENLKSLFLIWEKLKAFSYLVTELGMRVVNVKYENNLYDDLILHR